jgi:hypothetical protein
VALIDHPAGTTPTRALSGQATALTESASGHAAARSDLNADITPLNPAFSAACIADHVPTYPASCSRVHRASIRSAGRAAAGNSSNGNASRA